MVIIRSRPSEGQFALLHIPHASKFIPRKERKSFVLSDRELRAELIRMTDSYTGELFDCNPALACRVVFPVSRLVVDPERFVHDAEEPMAKKCMGVVYVSTSKQTELRAHPSTEERPRLIEDYWKPHHDNLRIAVEKALAANSKCLIIDCHSFPSSPLPYEPDQSPDRPDICIGTDSDHTPQWLRDLSHDSFHSRGFRVKFDSPYLGTMVPITYRTNPAVLSVMIEVNRSRYMDETSGHRNIGFATFKSKLTDILEALISGALMRPGLQKSAEG